MSHKNDSDIVKDSPDKMTQCCNCLYFDDQSDRGFCANTKREVIFNSRCNDFKGRN